MNKRKISIFMIFILLISSSMYVVGLDYTLDIEYDYLNFAEPSTIVLDSTFDNSGKKGYYFVAFKTGYYFIENAANCDYTLTTDTGDISEDFIKYGDDADRYFLKKGQKIYILLRGNANSKYSAQLKPPQGSDIVFEQNTDGKYIFSNSPETITDDYVADNPGGRRDWLMRNPWLGDGFYSMALYHHTRLAYPIFIDAEFFAQNDAKITVTNFGYGKAGDGEEWASLNVYADYLNESIYAPNDVVYAPKNMNLPYSFTIKQGTRVWMSDIYKYVYNSDRYPTIGGYVENNRADEIPMFSMMDFNIEYGNIDVNIMAYVNRDSSTFNCNGDASYIFETHHKGVADSLPYVSTDLTFDVSDDMEDGEFLLGKTFTDRNFRGFETYQWNSHINPQSDIWSGDLGVESDMLALKYKDNNKRNFYGVHVPESEKDATWIFDTKHTQVRTSNVMVDNRNLLVETLGDTSKDFKPNDLLINTHLSAFPYMTEENFNLLAASMGNYGVIEKYKIKVNNTGNKKRYFYYRLSALSNVVIERNGSYVLKNIDSRNEYNAPQRTESEYFLAELEPNSMTTVEFSIVLPTADSGGLGNAFFISDERKEEA